MKPSTLVTIAKIISSIILLFYCLAAWLVLIFLAYDTIINDFQDINTNDFFIYFGSLLFSISATGFGLWILIRSVQNLNIRNETKQFNHVLFVDIAFWFVILIGVFIAIFSLIQEIPYSI